MTIEKIRENFVNLFKADSRFENHSVTAKEDGVIVVTAPDGIMGMFYIPDDHVKYYLSDGGDDIYPLYVEATYTSIVEERANQSKRNVEAV